MMKTRLLIFGVLTIALCFYSCEKTSSDDQTTNASSDEKTNPDDKTENGSNDDETVNLPELPELEDVDDVCTKMKDINFMAYCYDNFDVNHDSKVSMTEAAAVSTISCSTASDFTGIEYFSNLQSFESSSAKYLDLRYNTQLTYIHCEETSIEELDLRYCTNMTTIGERAFYKCTGLVSTKLPHSIILLDRDAFEYCSNLITVFLPEGLTEIYSGVFEYCESLTNIELPSSLTSIRASAFADCTNLKIVTSNAITPPYINKANGTDPTFHGCSSLTTLYVPSESVDSYKDSDWADYFTEILPL